MQEINWKNGETYETDRPADIEKGGALVKVRRNITRETHTVDNEKRKVWVYEYANMTQTQYENYMLQLAELESPFAQLITESNTAQMEAVAALYEATLATQDNQQAIMEGIAELYETGVTVE